MLLSYAMRNSAHVIPAELCTHTCVYESNDYTNTTISPWQFLVLLLSRAFLKKRFSGHEPLTLFHFLEVLARLLTLSPFWVAGHGSSGLCLISEVQGTKRWFLFLTLRCSLCLHPWVPATKRWTLFHAGGLQVYGRWPLFFILGAGRKQLILSHSEGLVLGWDSVWLLFGTLSFYDFRFAKLPSAGKGSYLYARTPHI